MKKLLLVLLVLAMAAFLFVGCLPTTPPTDGEDEGDGEVTVCPTIEIAGSYTDATTGIVYVKGKSSGVYKVTLTYAQPTEGVIVQVVGGGYPTATIIPVTVSADGLTYTAEVSATTLTALDCESFMIIATDCYGECTCTKTFTVDKYAPKAKMMLSVDGCPCYNCEIALESDYTIPGTCVDALGCCADDCSGFASWSVDVYAANPFDICCLIPCEVPIKSCEAAACPIDCTTGCVVGDDYSATDTIEYYYIVMSMLDNVGNEAKYYARVKFNSGCTVSVIEYWLAANKDADADGVNDCNDWSATGKFTPTIVTSTTYGMYAIIGDASCTW